MRTNKKTGGSAMSGRLTLCAALLALACVLLASTARTASASSASTWWWTSGACKSTLKNSGVRLADGRVFWVAQAYCIGDGGYRRCSWRDSAHSERMHSRFYVVARSFNDTLRTFNMVPTGRYGFRVDTVRAHGDWYTYGAIQGWAWDLARDQQALGCGPP